MGPETFYNIGTGFFTLVSSERDLIKHSHQIVGPDDSSWINPDPFSNEFHLSPTLIS